MKSRSLARILKLWGKSSDLERTLCRFLLVHGWCTAGEANSRARICREQTVSTGTEFAAHRPHGDDARSDERFVRILLVEDRAVLADEIRQSLGQAGRASFDVVCETSLVEAAAHIRGASFDLLLMDPMLPNVERHAALELANDLAHRLPVVVLTGTEAFAGAGEEIRQRLRTCVEHADVPGKLLSAIKRSRRLGTGVMTPIFCRLEGFFG